MTTHGMRSVVAMMLSTAALAAGLCLSVCMADDAAPAAKPQTHGFNAANSLKDSELDAIKGTGNLSQTVVANNSSTVSNNSVNGDSTTGSVVFGNAFQELHGLAVISANSGNNVSINSSLNVTVSLAH